MIPARVLLVSNIKTNATTNPTKHLRIDMASPPVLEVPGATFPQPG
jgi:hypothetical protein